MYHTQGQIRLSATDLANHLSCAHLTQQNLKAARRELEPPNYRDLNTDILRERGFEHEAAYLKFLKDQYGYDAERISDELEADTALAQTRMLMEQGVPVIVQAVLADGQWHGRADVLLRTAEYGSNLGDYAYEVVDTKLARATRAETILQLCLYAELIESFQGVLPKRIGVVTPEHLRAPDPRPDWYSTLDYMAYFRHVQARLTASITVEPETYPDPVQRCELCRWWPNCNKTWRRDDHLSFVAGVTRSQRKELTEHSISTLTQLAETPSPIPFTPNRGARATYENLREQARVQLKGRLLGNTYHELKPLEVERGFSRLPEPSRGDLFFDIEGDQFANEAGLEYLFGVSFHVCPDDQEEGALTYLPFWSIAGAEDESDPSEKAAFEAFMDFVAARRAEYPDLHIYHFDHYEPSALKRLMGRYAVREDQIDDLLRRHVFVDLHQVVREALIASVERYSIKDLERFYGFIRSVGLDIAGEERARLEHAIELGALEAIEPNTRAVVRAYNQDDCDSLSGLQRWLETLRGELVAAGAQVPRPNPDIIEPSEAFDERRAHILRLVESLTRDIPVEEAERTPAEHGRWLLAHCLDYYRRENKVAYWERFRLAELDIDDYFRESNALAGLEFDRRVGGTDKAPVHRYRFPVQEAVMRENELYDESGAALGTLEALDMNACTIDIKKRGATASHHPVGVYGATVYNVKTLEDSLLAIAEQVDGNDIENPGPYQAARDLLLRTPPRLQGRSFVGEFAADTLIDEMSQATLALDHAVLPVQGPPGSGKTYTGARVILELVRAGKTVGVCANSHKVIQHLLAGVVAAAAEAGVAVEVGAKPKEKADLEGTGIQAFTDNRKVEAAIHGDLQVLGGTKYLWSRSQMQHAVDVLVVDEASQISLADALAISPAAASLVLIGDPRQLDQPQQGTHPPGVEASALDHLLDAAGTMPPEKGIFISRTRRLHPAICAFTSDAFYEGRLTAYPALTNQALIDCGEFSGAGLHYVAVAHAGNQSKSLEEVAAVETIYQTLLGGRWRDPENVEHEITEQEILIVAPYNAQVGALTEALPDARIGTVDKFQGQEAPVVIYSMATSSQEDAPRGMEFLYSANRLNVATSRARCAVVLVCSPGLFDVVCRTPQQAGLADGFCRYLEMSVTRSN